MSNINQLHTAFIKHILCIHLPPIYKLTYFPPCLVFKKKFFLPLQKNVHTLSPPLVNIILARSQIFTYLKTLSYDINAVWKFIKNWPLSLVTNYAHLNEAHCFRYAHLNVAHCFLYAHLNEALCFLYAHLNEAHCFLYAHLNDAHCFLYAHLNEAHCFLYAHLNVITASSMHI